MARNKATSRQRIVEEAARLFELRGYHETTIDDIAASVGVAKPTIYRYVRSKQQVLEEIFERLVTRLRRDLERVASIHDPQSQLRELVRSSVVAVADLRPHFTIFFYEDRELPTRSRRRFRQYARGINETVATILERCQRAGVLRQDVQPKLAALFLLGMITSMARWFDPSGPLNADQMADQVLRFFAPDALKNDTMPVTAPPSPRRKAHRKVG